MMKIFLKMYISLIYLFLFLSCTSGKMKPVVEVSENEQATPFVLGAEQIYEILPKLQNKRIALVVNHTSLVGQTHLVDTLLKHNVNIVKVFSPEHGFRGDADAGELVKNEVDTRTNLPIVSLYGKNKKPTAEQLSDVDLTIFDIQDVGTRFYTYISTLHYLMEASAENKKKVLVLDRPNPNGHFVDGPVLDLKFKSFVGMHPIPVVHGVTVGEIAQMINGQKWLEGGLTADIEVVKMKNYTPDTPYSLPVKPSPNLPNDQSIKLYPSICFFEGTMMSLGRGTQFPFQVVGYPDEKFGSFTFTPTSIDGMAKNPPHEDKTCYGVDLRNEPVEDKISLSYLIKFYNLAEDKKKFFNNYFNTLAGNDILKKQIISGMKEEEIRKTWQKDLDEYRNMRKNYLLY